MPLIIAGERSGVGKTTVTLALLSYLCQHGLTVQSFKVGPDYIDPMFHRYVTGRACRNLDPVLTSEAYVQQCFATHAQTADVALVEGVMGLFDGAAAEIGGQKREGRGQESGVRSQKSEVGRRELEAGESQFVGGFGSTAHVARLLQIPILLVVDCSRMSQSIAALVHGYRSFDPNLEIAGLVLNRVGSDRHLELLQSALEPLNIPILGVLRRQDSITLRDRHLGLIPTAELQNLDAVINQLAHFAQDWFDWEQLMPLVRSQKPEARSQKVGDEESREDKERSQKPEARSQESEDQGGRGDREDGEGFQNSKFSLVRLTKNKIQNSPTLNLQSQTPPLPHLPQPPHLPHPLTHSSTPYPLSPIPYPLSPISPPLRLAVAQDAAFNFYYQDNLDLLAELGAELVPWSPLRDSTLPENVQGLYFGGGFPEMFGEPLAANSAALAAVRAAIEAGIPTYAECGGLMYLCQKIVDFQEQAWEMVGILPTTAVMGKRLTLGYRRVEAMQDGVMFGKGAIAWGHEFHRSHLTLESSTPVFEIKSQNPLLQKTEGWHLPNLHASYIHLHWGVNPEVPIRFLEQCQKIAKC